MRILPTHPALTQASGCTTSQWGWGLLGIGETCFLPLTKRSCSLSSPPPASHHRCDSTEKLKALLPRLEQELKDTEKFKDFYQFTFTFAKNPGQKGLGEYKTQISKKPHLQTTWTWSTRFQSCLLSCCYPSLRFFPSHCFVPCAARPVCSTIYLNTSTNITLKFWV